MIKEIILNTLSVFSFLGAIKFLYYQIVDIVFYYKMNWNFGVQNPMRDKSLRVNEFSEIEPSAAARVLMIQPITIFSLLALSYFCWRM
jgi:hypothetical protein